jgi:DNA-binding protein HU-beta
MHDDSVIYLYYLHKMTKTQLIAHLADKAKISKRLAGDVLNILIESIVSAVKTGDSVSIQGFGTFKASHRAARTGVNPQNPSQKIQIPAMKLPSFKAGSDFKKAVR